MIKKNSSITLSASMIAVAVLLSSCGGGSSGDSGDMGDISPVVTEPVTNTDVPIVNNQAQPTVIDVTDASIVSQATKAPSGIVARSGRGFSFPSVVMQGSGMSMTIPGGPLPKFPARRTIVNGTGETIEFGDAVTLKYDMFAWSDGALVESSELFEEAHTVQGGVSDAFPIPEYLAKSLLGRKLGDTVQVVLPVGTVDLPAYLDQNDAYVLLVELL